MWNFQVYCQSSKWYSLHCSFTTLLCVCVCVLIRWLLMWSTNLWRSAISRKPVTDVYGCDYLFMAQVLTSHTVTHGVFTAPTLSGISMYSSRSRRPPCAETVSKWEFYFSGNTKKWSSDDESWAINAWNQIPLLSNWYKKELFDFGFLFSIHDIINSNIAQRCDVTIVNTPWSAK